MLERTALLTDFCHSHTLRRWTVRRSCCRLFSPSALSYTPYDAAVSYEMAVRLLCHGAMIYNKPLRDYYAMAVPLQRHPTAMYLQPRHELSRMALPSLWNGMMRRTVFSSHAVPSSANPQPSSFVVRQPSYNCRRRSQTRRKLRRRHSCEGVKNQNVSFSAQRFAF